MNAYRLTPNILGRRAAAVLVLAGTAVACLWIGTYTAWPKLPTPSQVGWGTPLVIGYTPAWAVPAAVAVGIIGAILAFLVLRPDPARR